MTDAANVVIDAELRHRVAYEEVMALLKKHTADVSALEMLAVAANLVGKLIALQDKRTTTVALAMKTIEKNIQIGNAEAIAMLGSIGEQKH